MSIKIQTYLDPMLQLQVDDLEKLIQILVKKYQDDKSFNILDVFDNRYYIMYTEQILQIYYKFTKVKVVLE